jgi:hypothetical protein
MDDSEPTVTQDELRDELRQVETSLVVVRRQLDELREARGEPDALPDTSDDAVLIRELEDQEAIEAELESRRQTLLERLS